MNSVITHPWLDGAYYGLPGGAIIVGINDVRQNTALFFRANECASQCMHDRMVSTVRNATYLCEQMLAEKKHYEEKRKAVSQALWCDSDADQEGGHAFSGRDRNKQRFTVNYTDDNGREIEEVHDVCGRHAVVKKAIAPPRSTHLDDDDED